MSLASAIRSLRATLATLASARSAVANIEASPVWDGTTRTVKLTVPLIDEVTGKAVRTDVGSAEHPKGKVVRVTIEREVEVSRSSQYRKAIRNRRAAAKRVARAEAKFAFLASTLPADKVREVLATA